MDGLGSLDETREAKDSVSSEELFDLAIGSPEAGDEEAGSLTGETNSFPDV